MARTAFLRLPRAEWASITQGSKRELRYAAGTGPPLGLFDPPTPIVVYSPYSPYGGEPRYELMVLESCWREPLGAISAESLAAEGFESLAEFRRYWRRRYRKSKRVIWDPERPVSVFRLRLWRGQEDEEHFGRLFMQRLYLDPISQVR